ncbi:hypothetical protein CFOL_v3_09512 [Cephalotus follicularis]|uniref:MAPK kinase substrate protein At1g80180-like n=1 Tax=Cephalotus follicularis TaxID=3775 RepID=A0A1Q3BDA4_CEPFO|nr:hypothetical protein CFOL_v3_09512 [Cephalotus follicularis]
MAGLQRSAISFRRQGSSGFVWDDRFLSGELNKVKQSDERDQEQQPQPQPQQQQEKLDSKDIPIVKPSRTVGIPIERSRSNGGTRGYRTGKVSPAIEPSSPKVSACGFCTAFGKPPKKARTRPGKRRSR